MVNVVEFKLKMDYAFLHMTPLPEYPQLQSHFLVFGLYLEQGEHDKHFPKKFMAPATH